MYVRGPGATTQSGICFICRRGFEIGELGSFPGFHFEPDYPDARYGQICVCDNCTAGLAETLGYVAGEQSRAAVEYVTDRLQATEAERDAAVAKVEEGVAGVLKLVKAAQRSSTPAKARQKPLVTNDGSDV